jgi:hypothetical protein
MMRVKSRISLKCRVFCARGAAIVNGAFPGAALFGRHIKIDEGPRPAIGGPRRGFRLTKPSRLELFQINQVCHADGDR